MSNLIRHQPRPAEDPDLDAEVPPFPKRRFYSSDDGVLQKNPSFLPYPETRVEIETGAVRPVFEDEFVGTTPSGTSSDPVPNDTMLDLSRPDSILGGELINSGNPFDVFLVELQQLCRNYNHDLFQLRQDLFRKKFQTAAFNLPPKVTAFERSADQLSAHLRAHDSRLSGNNGKFSDIVVEFVKVNGYIASIRAGCTEFSTFGGSLLEAQYSSSSHISISSMYSSHTSS